MRKVNRLCQNQNLPHKKQRLLRENRRFVRNIFFGKDTKNTEKSVLFVCVFVQFACVIIKTLSPMSVAPGDFLLSS